MLLIYYWRMQATLYGHTHVSHACGPVLKVKFVTAAKMRKMGGWEKP